MQWINSIGTLATAITALVAALAGLIRAFQRIRQVDNDARGGFERQRKVLEIVEEAIEHVLTKYEYEHLVRLASGNGLERCQYSEFLKLEMIRLCQHEFIQETPPGSLWDLPKDTPFNLGRYFAITDKGRRHIEQRQRLASAILELR